MSVAILPFPPQSTTRRPFRLSLVLAARAAFHKGCKGQKAMEDSRTLLAASIRQMSKYRRSLSVETTSPLCGLQFKRIVSLGLGVEFFIPGG